MVLFCCQCFFSELICIICINRSHRNTYKVLAGSAIQKFQFISGAIYHMTHHIECSFGFNLCILIQICIFHTIRDPLAGGSADTDQRKVGSVQTKSLHAFHDALRLHITLGCYAVKAANAVLLDPVFENTLCESSLVALYIVDLENFNVRAVCREPVLQALQAACGVVLTIRQADNNRFLRHPSSRGT